MKLDLELVYPLDIGKLKVPVRRKRVEMTYN